jgi:hypothetical protein
VAVELAVGEGVALGVGETVVGTGAGETVVGTTDAVIEGET